MTTQVTCTFAVTMFGNNNAAVSALLGAAPIDTSLLQQMAVTVASDATLIGGNQATRTIVLQLNQPPYMVTNTFVPAGASGTNQSPFIVSTSANDSSAGTGAQTVTITYNDAAGGSHTTTVSMNGTTPVSLGKVNVAAITGFTIASAGSDLANDGVLTIWAVVPNESAQYVFGTVPASYYTAGDVGDVGGFYNWMAGEIQAVVRVPIVIDTPVFS